MNKSWRKFDKAPVVGRADAVKAGRVLEYKTAKDEAPPLPPGSDPRPPGRGWLLVDYSWHEKTGVGRLVYRRRWNPKERVVVSVWQPAPHTDRWSFRPAINHDEVLGRYFEALRVTMAMQAEGVYGR